MEEIGRTELRRELSSKSRFPKEERSRKWLTRPNPVPSHCQVRFCQFMVKRAFSPNFTQCSRPSSSPTCPTDQWWPVIAKTLGYLSLIHRLALNYLLACMLFNKTLCAWVLSTQPGCNFHWVEHLWNNYPEFPMSLHFCRAPHEPLINMSRFIQ